MAGFAPYLPSRSPIQRRLHGSGTLVVTSYGLPLSAQHGANRTLKSALYRCGPKRFDRYGCNGGTAVVSAAPARILGAVSGPSIPACMHCQFFLHFTDPRRPGTARCIGTQPTVDRNEVANGRAAGPWSRTGRDGVRYSQFD